MWGFAVGMKSWFLLLVCSPCVSKTVWKLFGLSITNSIRGSIQWQGTGKISGFLNKPLQDALGSAPDIILNTLFCNLKTLQLLVALPQNDSIPDDWIKLRKVCHS